MALSLRNKSFVLRKEDAEHNWLVVDADKQIVGRLATQIATVLMGKHKPTYTPHVLCGDFVVVINAERVRFTGKEMGHPEIPYYTKKMGLKEYEKFTGYPGGRKIETAEQVWKRRPEMITTEAVRRMLPKNRLGRQMLKMLKVYKGAEHPHQAQQPEAVPDYLLNR
ncbi:MAG: 50S ribosomal protein L13 [Planctomycetota bacterium]|nr:50S ribosomal protein L13 [Planctomycetota bacterium]